MISKQSITSLVPMQTAFFSSAFPCVWVGGKGTPNYFRFESPDSGDCLKGSKQAVNKMLSSEWILKQVQGTRKHI